MYDSMLMVTMTLHASQEAALNHVGEEARRRKDDARRVIDEVLGMSNVAPDAWARAVDAIREHARIALHFHPDRPDARGWTVAESLLECGVYKNQFETLLSNGHVAPYTGGPRDRWEQKLFGGAYQRAGVEATHRPKYGALDLMRHADGPSPRFGSCWLLLAPAVSRRATFTYLDSHDVPADKGTLDELDSVLAALLHETFTRDFALGERELTPRRLVAHLTTELAKPFADPSTGPPMRNLNHYIEAQVHGDVRIGDDVDILVADPSFRDGDVGAALRSIADRYAIRLHWHCGFVMSARDVPDDFRGPTMPSLAARVAVDGSIDAAGIGAAARGLKRDPAAWRDRGDYETVLQELKLLWHVLVRFGKPYGA
jgi:Protein of unknown function (DUF3626)